MGYYIRFIHNRDLAGENIMTAVCRVRLVLDSPPGTLSGLMERLELLNISLPSRSALGSAKEHMKVRGDVPGMYGMQLKPSRRNHRLLGIDSVPCDMPGSFTSAVLRPLMRSLNWPTSYIPAPGSSCMVMTAGSVTSRNITQYHAISRNITQYHAISRNITQYHAISRNIT